MMVPEIAFLQNEKQKHRHRKHLNAEHTKSRQGKKPGVACRLRAL